MSENIAFRLAKKALEDEILATSIYGRLAERLGGEPLGSKFEEISKMEARHVEFWRSFLKREAIRSQLRSATRGLRVTATCWQCSVVD